MPEKQNKYPWVRLTLFTLAIVAFIFILIPLGGPRCSPAPMMQTETQARGIQTDRQVYAMANHHLYPDTLAAMYHNNFFTPDYVIAPNSGVSVPADFEQWSGGKQEMWFAKNASFVFVPGLTDQDDPKKIAVFEKPKCAINGRIAVAFNNGDAHAMDIARVEVLLKEQTGKTIAELVTDSENPQPKH